MFSNIKMITFNQNKILDKKLDEWSNKKILIKL